MFFKDQKTIWKIKKELTKRVRLYEHMTKKHF
jgi:hypothetical protein